MVDLEPDAGPFGEGDVVGAEERDPAGRGVERAEGDEGAVDAGEVPGLGEVEDDRVGGGRGGGEGEEVREGVRREAGVRGGGGAVQAGGRGEVIR